MGQPTRAAADAADAAAVASARVEAAAAAHPDDPDLAWAHALDVAARGEPGRAADLLAGFEARWPARRPDVVLERGRLLFLAGRDAEAVEVLERALALPTQQAGLARFYRGLALRRLGVPEEARRELSAAARDVPALGTEVLFLEALDRLAQGDEDGGRRLLDQVVRLDPSSETARRAQILSGARSLAPTQRRLALVAQGGFEYDSNVSLESGSSPLADVSEQRDTRLLWSAGSTLWPLRGAWGGLLLGYRYDQAVHDDLSSFDTQTHGAFASALWNTGERSALRLDTLHSFTRLDGESYYRSHGVRPNFFLGLGRRLGILRLYADTEQQSYADEPFPSSLERDALAYGGGFEHTVPLLSLQDAWVTLGGRYLRTDTEAKRDLLGFEGAYDHDRWVGTVQLQIPLPFELAARSSLFWALEDYDHPNVIGFLLQGGDTARRRDRVGEASLALILPLHRLVELELSWRGTSRRSNVDVYAYRRQVFGLQLRAQTR